MTYEGIETLTPDLFAGIIICIFGLRTNQHSLIMKKRFILLAALAAMLLGVSCSSVHRVSSASVVQPGFELEECDIENPGTRMFLEEVDYSNDPDYTLSFARDYRSDIVGWRNCSEDTDVQVSPIRRRV